MFGVLTCKMLFLKIFPLLYLVWFHRATTERTPTEYLMTKKALFLRLSPKKVDLIPEKVVSPPKKVDSLPKKVYFIPKIVDLSVITKNRLKAIFICTVQNKFVPLHAETTHRFYDTYPQI